MIVYEDEFVTEYSSGHTEVRFSDEEWAAMHRDPVAFGFAAPCGHAVDTDSAFYIAEGCPKCFAAGEAGGPPPPPDYPRIRCGHCDGSHVGVGAVLRCAQTR